MAETIANELVKVVFHKLADEVLNRYARAKGIQSELNNLGRALTQIQDLLYDAAQKEVKDASVRQWLNDLQHLAYDIDDVLDDVATEATHRELTQVTETNVTSKVRKLIPTCLTNFALSHRLSRKLDGITAELQYLENRKTVLGLIEEKEKEKPKSNSRRNETSLLEPNVIGREGEEEKLLNKLLSNESSSKEKFSIIPIVGMGGVGKTTLARLLYNDTRVKDCFELQAWVCVSDDFDIYKISKTIFQAVSGENKEFADLNLLQIALKEKLKDKLFLLILDDVWNQNSDDWEKLVLPFHSAAPGSKIILTTREDYLLKKLGFDHLDRLASLSYEDALSLLAVHALGVDNFNSDPTLRLHGEGIVKKCGCLPLALKAIGRLLRTKSDRQDWDDVLNSEIWDLENSDEIVPALRLSYLDLSADLKQLFSYCSLFPKDFLFDKEQLVLLWMAEGYLNQSSSIKSPERLGREFFEQLLSRSFFQYAPNDESLFVMHDLMNDLATYISGDYFLRFEERTVMSDEALAKYRHMSFVREEYVGYKKFEALSRAKSLRTLLAVYVGEDKSRDPFYFSNKILVDLLPKLPQLRVLCLNDFQINEVPESVGDLKHLRYLNLSQTKIKELPENVGNLYNLETLIIFGCNYLTKFPRSFIKLKKLRHLDIRDTPALKKLPLGIGELRNLQTLTKVIVGEGDDFSITELKELKNLHGELSIENLHIVQRAMHARDANLSLKGLTKLELNWDNEFDASRRETLEKEILSELKPCSDELKELAIVAYGGIDLPNWVGDPSFGRLVYVSIRGCRNCTSLPSFEKLPSLKKLFIQGMDNVKVIGLESTGTTVVFPSLEILSFEDMLNWEEWSANSNVVSDEVVFPRLRKLHIKNCPKLSLISLEAMASLKVLKIVRCGDGVLRSLVRAASKITKLEIWHISGITDEIWRGVIEYLVVVEEVRMWGCEELRYLWESEAEASKVLANLKELSVSYCSNMVSLGEKEEEEGNSVCNLLSSLKHLEVESCHSMKRLCCPDNIETLKIRMCSSLTCVSFSTTATGGGGGQKLKSLRIVACDKLMEKLDFKSTMPMLENIVISGWTHLKSIIQFSSSIHLTHLSIETCQSMVSLRDLQLPNLTNLDITNCQNIESFRDLQLPNLTNLDITNCQNIVSFPDIRLPNLTHLIITNCQNIKSFPNLQLPNLTNLAFVDCQSLESFPDFQLSNLTMLQVLYILNCPSIDASFPHGHWPPNLVSLGIGRLKKPISEWGPQNFPTSLVDLRLFYENVVNFSKLSNLLPSSLRRLSIVNFDKLESLSTGPQHLTSLQQLYIANCPKMKHLPKTLLPSLLRLEIGGCANLKERYKGRGISHYWPLISHIPCIEIH